MMATEEAAHTEEQQFDEGEMGDEEEEVSRVYRQEPKYHRSNIDVGTQFCIKTGRGICFCAF